MKFKFSLFFTGVIICCATLGFSQSVGINTTTPHSATALDVKPIGFQGFAPPRFSGNVNASFGLTGVSGVGTFYYDTLNQLYRYYAGSGSWLTFGGASSGVSGAGVAGRVSFWTGTTSLSSNGSFVWDNTDSRLGIGQSTPLAKVDVLNSTSTSESSLRISNTVTGNSSSLFEASTNGNGPGFNLTQTGWGVGTQISINNSSSSSTVFTANTTGLGHVIDAQKSGTSVFRAESTGDVYFSRALKPGNNAGTVGQLLVSDGAGSAPKWTDPAMTGTGIKNYAARWGSSTHLSTGILQDDSAYVGVNTAPSAGAGRMYVIAGKINVPAIRGESADGTNANNTGILGMAGSGSSSSTGISGLASSSTNVKAVNGWATGVNGGYAYGMYSRVDGKSDFTYGYYATVMPQAGKAYGLYAAISGTASHTYGIYSDVSLVTAGMVYSAAFMGGNVGIGTDAPNELLDVEGSVEIDGEYKYESEKDRVFNVPGNSFNLINVNATNVKVMGDISENGMSVYLKDGGAGQGELYAPINLPTGSLLYGVESYVYDSDISSDIIVNVYRKDLGTDASPVEIGIEGKSTSSKLEWVIVKDLKEIIDNKKFYYYVRVRMSESSSDHRLFSTSFLYSVKSAD